MPDDRQDGAMNPHVAEIEADFSARSKWAEIDEEILKRRLGKRKKNKTKPYAGAPNGVVPIIDDVTRERTEQEITMVSNAPRYAHLLALGKVDPALLEQAELAFDTYLRFIISLRSKLEEGIDTKNARGFAIFKTFRSEHVQWGTIPDADAIDPRDVVVPWDTKELKKARRITHVLRLTPEEVRERAKTKLWRNVEAVIQKAKSDRDDGRKEKDTLSVTANLVGLTTSGGKDSKTVCIWEVWTYANEFDAAADKTGQVQKGDKCCVIFSPDAPDLILSVYPWREKDRFVELSPEEAVAEAAAALAEKRDPKRGKMVKGRERAWPFVQCRYENRSRHYYATRGIGHLCMDDQIFATGELNAKMTMVDYFQQPMLKSNGHQNSTNITFLPGSFLPDGVEFATPPQIPAQFDFDVEMFKRNAARRGGAGSQYEFSGNMSTSRKTQKTATEVQEESARTGMISTSSADRFNDPLRELYQQLWDDLARLKKPLPIIDGDSYTGEMGAEIYAVPMLAVPASSAKTHNPELQFVKSRDVVTWLAPFKDLVPIEFQEAVRDVMAYWDPIRAKRWISDPKKQGPGNLPPIYTILKSLQEQLNQLAKAAQGLSTEVEQHDKILANVAKAAVGAADAVKNGPAMAGRGGRR